MEPGTCKDGNSNAARDRPRSAGSLRRRRTSGRCGPSISSQEGDGCQSFFMAAEPKQRMQGDGALATFNSLRPGG